MRELSLFTGAGGGLLGSLILGWRTVAAVELDAYCQRVLCARGGYVGDTERAPEDIYSEGSGPRDAACQSSSRHAAFPVFSDVRTFDGTAWRGKVDIVTGGFPCQPFSQAGKRLGADDPRNMWPSALRVLVESGAPLGFFENVPGLLSSGYFGTVLGDLAEAGFDAEWCVLGADDVGAPHRRKRLWILAYRRERGGWGGDLQYEGRGTGPCDEGEDGDMADTEDADGWPAADQDDAGRRTAEVGGPSLSPWWCDPADVGHATGGVQAEECGAFGGQSAEPAGSDDPWLLEPYVGRVAHGVASRVDRLRALGNGQVPQSMAVAFTYLARRAGVAHL